MELKRSPLLSSLPPQAEATSARARASRLSAADSLFGIYFLLFPIIDAGAYRCPPRRVAGVGMGLPSARAGVAELADARDSKSRVSRDVWVRPPPPACTSPGIRGDWSRRPSPARRTRTSARPSL